MRFALWFDMTLPSARLRQLANRVARMVPRLAAVIIGFIGMVLGVGMMVTIVMLPAGVVVALLVVAIFVAGIFAPDFSTPGVFRVRR
jgi:hypothetical protein